MVSVIGFFIFIFNGGQVREARGLVTQAIELSLQGDFTNARALVLKAVKYDCALMQVADVHSLYEIIVAGGKSALATGELQCIRAAMPDWPKTRLESYYYSENFHALFIIVAVVAGIGRVFARH